MSTRVKFLWAWWGALLAVVTPLCAEREAPARFVCEVLVTNADGRPYREAFAFEVSDPELIASARALMAGTAGNDLLPEFQIEPGDDELSVDFSNPRRPQWGWRVTRLVGFIDLTAVRLDTSGAKFTASPSAIAAGPANWIANNGDGYAPLTARLLTELGSDPDVTLLNLSTRAWVSNGEKVMIGGLVIHGNAPRTLLFRAIGPSLAAFDIATPLRDPTLSLHRGQTLLAFNDDWTSLAEETVATVPVNLRPADNREPMLVVTLPPGAYTTVLAGNDDAEGVAMVEIYDLERIGF